MAKKEKVSILREEQFEEVESALSEAIANLDATNDRIATLLNSDSHELPEVIANSMEAQGAPSGQSKAEETESSAESDAPESKEADATDAEAPAAETDTEDAESEG